MIDPCHVGQFPSNIWHCENTNALKDTCDWNRFGEKMKRYYITVAWSCQRNWGRIQHSEYNLKRFKIKHLEIFKYLHKSKNQSSSLSKTALENHAHQEEQKKFPKSINDQFYPLHSDLTIENQQLVEQRPQLWVFFKIGIFSLIYLLDAIMVKVRAAIFVSSLFISSLYFTGNFMTVRKR